MELVHTIPNKKRRVSIQQFVQSPQPSTPIRATPKKVTSAMANSPLRFQVTPSKVASPRTPKLRIQGTPIKISSPRTPITRRHLIFSPLPHQEEAPKKKQMDDRVFAVDELVVTEQNYVNALQTALETFLRPMLEDKTVPKGLSSHLVNSIQAIHTLHQEVLSAFVRYKQNRTAYDCGKVESVHNTMKDIVEFMMPSITQLHGDYCQKYDQTLNQLKDLRESNMKFASWLKEKGASELFSVLIMPIQRITRYHLLLMRIVNTLSPNDFEYATMPQALQIVKDAVAAVNTNVEEYRKSQQLANLAAHMVGIDNSEIFDSKGIVKEVNVLCNGNSALLCLFEDSVMLGRKEGDVYSLMMKCDLAVVFIVDPVPDSTRITILTPMGSFPCKFAALTSKNEWVQSFNTTIQGLVTSNAEVKNRRYRCTIHQKSQNDWEVTTTPSTASSQIGTPTPLVSKTPSKQMGFMRSLFSGTPRTPRTPLGRSPIRPPCAFRNSAAKAKTPKSAQKRSAATTPTSCRSCSAVRKSTSRTPTSASTSKSSTLKRHHKSSATTTSSTTRTPSASATHRNKSQTPHHTHKLSHAVDEQQQP
ncbi:A-kinase anchor protein 13 [Pelomyxa schiedti]|nr:A-kinase anchor protein 13 [Pelomyxa schiedti]